MNIMDGHESIDILMSTYNGHKYVSSQIDSIINQQYKNWRLLIRDDGSKDSTVSIIKNYVKTFPDKIIFVNDNNGNIGPVQSYLLLMRESGAQYIAFCDQDDVWEQEKLLRQFKLIREVEENVGRKKPLLIHCDLTVVDRNLRLISESLWKYQKLNPNKMAATTRILVQNCVTGCSMIVNRSLLESAMRINNPVNIIMHDWWLAVIAAANGKIINMPEQLVKYRQHSYNDIGARKWGASHAIDIIEEGIPELKKRLLATKVQAEELLRTGILGPEEEVIVRRYINAFELGWLKRRVVVFKFGYLKYGLARNIGMFCAL